MIRSIEIHAGWPPGEKPIVDADAELLRHQKEGWVIMAVEDGNRQFGMLSADWDSACTYAHGWMMGKSIEELQRNED